MSEANAKEVKQLLEKAAFLLIGRYLTEEEENLVDLLKCFKRIDKND